MLATDASTDMQKIKLILVEDHQMTRLGLRLMLEQEPHYTVIAEAETGQEALKVVNQYQGKCDLILMDIGLPDMDGIEATQQIKLQFPQVPVMMLTSKDEAGDVFAALGAGADAYCLKGASFETLKTAINTVSEGASWLDPGIARLVLGRFQGLPHLGAGAEKTLTTNQRTHTVVGLPVPHAPNQTMDCPLTPREMEVLKLIVEGFSNADIAEKCVITKATAKAHVHSILQKLCVDDRTQAAVFAMRQGIVRMEDINPIF
ncbi:MAG: response regulator transcription factor [Vampirovibrio sp.]